MMNLYVLSLLLLGFPCAVSHVVVDFNACKSFFKQDMPPKIPGIGKDNHYKYICQKYMDKYRYATLYDTTNKIPVFSAYKFIGKGKFKRAEIQPKNWMIESKLEAQSDAMTEPCVNQASSEDYSDNTQGYTRGHLFPSGHAPDTETATSTFTLTNVVPMTKQFNSHIWTKVENELANQITLHCKEKKDSFSGYVLTGTLPGKTKMNERVNIPSVIWTAFCCENKYSSAYWLDNKENADETITFKKLKELEDFLDDLLKSKNKIFTKLFHKDCKRNQMIHEDEML